MKRFILAASVAAAAIVSISTAQAQSGGPIWYYCDAARAYFPYVQTCQAPWRTVPAAVQRETVTPPTPTVEPAVRADVRPQQRVPDADRATPQLVILNIYLITTTGYLTPLEGGAIWGALACQTAGEKKVAEGLHGLALTYICVDGLTGQHLSRGPY